MDQATIQQIAAEVVRQLPSYPFTLMAVQVVLTLAAAGLGAYFGAYSKERGKNLATKHDFDELQKQLTANTETVERIKSDVAQKDWAQREWTNLRRTKLEALLEKIHDSVAKLERLGGKAVKGNFDAEEQDPVMRLEAIGTLYFPELKTEVHRFSQKCRNLTMLGLDHGMAVSRMRNDPNAYQSAHDSFQERWGSNYKEVLVARTELTTAARRLLVNIMGVEN